MPHTLTNPSRLAPTQPDCLPPQSPSAALTRGENYDAYDTLRRRMIAQMRPRDVFEEVLVGDVCDLVWEAARLRRIRARLLETTEHVGLAQVLEPHVDTLGRRNVVEGWARGNRPDVARVEESLAKAGLTMEHVAASTFVAQMTVMERLDRMLAAAEHRRAAALREIERHRASQVRGTRAGDIEDVVAADGQPHDGLGDPAPYGDASAFEAADDWGGLA